MQPDNMYQGNICGPTVVDDGAVQTGWGYRIQFMGSDKPKEITKKVVFAAIGVLLAIIVIATILGGKQPKDFPDVIQLRNSIGQPLEEAALKVGVKLADMTETEPGVYRSNKGIILDGVAFDLYFYAYDGICSGYAYIADYQADAKEASKDIYNMLVNMRIETFDKYPYYLYREDNVTYDVTRKNLRNHLENEEVLLVKHTYSSMASDFDYNDPTGMFMVKLDGSAGEFVTRKPVFYTERGVAYDAESQRVQIVHSCRIEPEREPKYGGN